MRSSFITSCLVLVLWSGVQAQDPLRFKEEVAKLTSRDSLVSKRKLILFTGSSSIRMWQDLEASFPTKNVLNRGFGGSVASDLIYYFDQLILPYHPKQLFIYEGDNDISLGKTPDQVLADFDTLIQLIRSKVSRKVEVVFITPKPSLARIQLKEEYIVLNTKLKAWAAKQNKVKVADVWPLLTDKQGNVFMDIFVEDGLHLNAKGYALWTNAIRPYIR